MSSENNGTALLILLALMLIFVAVLLVLHPSMTKLPVTLAAEVIMADFHISLLLNTLPLKRCSMYISLLNSSPIDESLGAGAYKVGGARQCSSTRKEVSTATLRVAPPRHCRTELFSGILTNQYLPGPELKRVGG